MENQSALQLVAQQPVSSDYTTHITLYRTTIAAGAFRRLVSIVIQSGHSVNCELNRCTIKPEEDVRQLQVEMENQSALQLVNLQAVSSDYTTHITLDCTTIAAGAFRRLVTGAFRRLVSIVIQSGHSVNCELHGCTIKPEEDPEEDVRQLQVEMENQSALQLVNLQPVSSDYTTHITLKQTTIAAGAFRRLVSIVIQSGHSVNCELHGCTIKPEEDVRQLQVEMENQSALQLVAQQPVSSDYTTHITLYRTTIAAGAFRRLVSIVIQSGHSVNCKLCGCTIQHEEDVRQLQVEMENQSALQLVAQQPVSSDYTTHITLYRTTIAAGAFRRLVSIVIQSGHSVNCELNACTIIKPEEDVRQLQVEMENQSALQLSGHSVNCKLCGCTIQHEEDVRQLQVEMENQSALQLVAQQPVSSDYTTHITLYRTTIAAGAFRRLVSIVIQSGHSVNCELNECTIIKPEEDPVSSDYTTHITLEQTTIAAREFRRLVSIVIQSGHSVNCVLRGCTIKPEEDVRQLQVEMENLSALQLVNLQPVSSDYTTHITLRFTTIAAGEFRRLVSIVIQSGHYMICVLHWCRIKPEEDRRQLQVEIENHSAVKLVRPFFQLDFCDDWSVEFDVNVK
ncbi:hypothetical protein MAR_030857, partial [Mya arenaria]